MKKFLLFAFLLLKINGFACSCVDAGKVKQVEFDELKGAYLGTVVKVEEFTEQLEEEWGMSQLERIRFSLLVSSVYKGDVLDTLIFETNKSSGMCGLHASLNDKLFVSWSEDAEDVPNVTICSRSLNYSSAMKSFQYYGFHLNYYFFDRRALYRDKRNVRRIKRFSRKQE